MFHLRRPAKRPRARPGSAYAQEKIEKSPEKGIITLPSYGGMMSLSAGTAPGTVASEMIEKMPSIARRPLLIST